MLQQITSENLQQMLARFTTAELENMVEKFPYFQQAHLLLAKKYQQENNPRFDRQLQLAALYTTDRSLLFNLFHEKITGPAVVTKKPEPVIEKTEEFKVDKIEVPVIKEEPEKVVEEEIIAAPVEEPAVQEPTVEPAFNKNEEHSFDEWLQALGKIQLPEKPNAETPAVIEAEEEELNRTIMQNMPVDFLAQAVEEETHYSRGLEDFIEEQIQKHKHTASVQPAEEGDLDPAMITETMAKVYEMQKKYNRAIKAYEHLSLKFPEKSGYFAARIQAIKDNL